MVTKVEKQCVNEIATALKNAGIKFDKKDVFVMSSGVVRLGFKTQTYSGDVVDLPAIISNIKGLGYLIDRVTKKEVVYDGRRWLSIDIGGTEGRRWSAIRFITIDEVYGVVYIDV